MLPKDVITKDQEKNVFIERKNIQDGFEKDICIEGDDLHTINSITRD